MIDNDSDTTGNRRRTRAIRARMAATGEKYTAAARGHDTGEGQDRHAEPLRLIMLGGSIPVADVSQAPGPIVPIVRCPRCADGVLVVEPQPRCAACGQIWEDGRAVAEEYAERILHLDWYTAATDGAEPPVEECPECGETAVVWDEFGSARAGRIALCFTCGAFFYDRCTRCNRPMIFRQPGDSLVCSMCWDEVIHRD
jgi:hypothetical protein